MTTSVSPNLLARIFEAVCKGEHTVKAIAIELGTNVDSVSKGLRSLELSGEVRIAGVRGHTRIWELAE